jgi:sterol desaturase/sphingolipid hydroxylase (fatty acid hydroxylase superfamily)
LTGSAWLDLPAEAIRAIGSYVASPDKRLYVGYLCTSAVLALWVFRRTGREGSFFRYLLHRGVWLSRSAKVDYQLVLFNSLFKAALIGQVAAYGLHIAFWTEEALRRWLGPTSLAMDGTTTVLIYTLVMTVIGDLSVYIVHRFMHRSKSLWALHSVHHSAETLSPVTLLRVHPLELVINTLRSLVVFGLLAGLFGYLSRHQVTPVTLLGVNAVTFLFFASGANLRHSHVQLAYWPGLEHLLISPRQHQIHHSSAPEHHHRNFGSKFALWDWMFGTLETSRQVRGPIHFGLGVDEGTHGSLWDALSRPLGSALGRRSKRG